MRLYLICTLVSFDTIESRYQMLFLHTITRFKMITKIEECFNNNLNQEIRSKYTSLYYLMFIIHNSLFQQQEIE